MGYLLKAATIIDAESPHHLYKRDIRIRNGNISEIGDDLSIENDDQVWEANAAYVSPGWVDLRSHFGDPGMEHLEELKTGAAAAAAGGFTHVGILPDTDPWIANKSQVTYLKDKARQLPISLLPLATISKPDQPNELTEMLDLANAGVQVFTQGDRSIADADFLKRAMQYVSAFGGRLMLYPQLAGLHEGGQMNEGITNIQLGLTGTPAMAEHIAIQRDIELCRYTGARIHFSKVTSARSLQFIAAARQEALPITCDTAVHYLLYHEQHLQGYPTNLKFDPPLRTPEDQDALIEGLKNGVIDALISDHQPVEWEAKACEFPLAKPGAIGLQTVLPHLKKALSKDTLLQAAIPALTSKPREILALPPARIAEGYPAHLTAFNLSGLWNFDEQTNQSRSTNSIWYGHTLEGMIEAVFHNGELKHSAKEPAARP